MFTKLDGYWISFLFLKGIYFIHKDEYDWDFPILLSDMQLLEDEISSDPAQLQDWNNCLVEELVSEKDVFDAMFVFLEQYRQRGDRGEIRKLLDYLTQDSEAIAAEWQKHVEDFVVKYK